MPRRTTAGCVHPPASTTAGFSLTELLVDTLGRRFESDPDRSWYMYDQIAVASLIDPTLVTTERLYVDVDINHGISYGTSVGGTETWPGAEDAVPIILSTKPFS